MADVKWSDDAVFIPESSLTVADEVMGLRSSNTNVKFPASAFGDVHGPVSSTNNDLAVFDGTTGKLLKDGGIPITSVGNVVGPASSVDERIPVFDGTTGKLLKQSSVRIAPTGEAFGFTDIHGTSFQGQYVNINNFTPTQIYVASLGSDVNNNGQIIKPYLDVVYADSITASGDVVIVSAGIHVEGSLLKKPFSDITGVNKNNTSFTAGGGSAVLGINDALWIAATAPKFGIYNITMHGDLLNYVPSIYVPNSQQIFSNGKITSTPGFFNAGYVTNLLIDNQYIQAPRLHSCENLVINLSEVDGDAIFYNDDDVNIPVFKVKILNSKFNGSLTFTTGYVGSGTYEIEIINSPGITNIFYDDNFSSIDGIISIDSTSMPSTGITSIGAGNLVITYLTNISNGVSTANGFSLGSGYFRYSGDTDRTLLCGVNASYNIGTVDCIVLGKSLANHASIFIAADTQAPTQLQATSPYQFVTRYYNGYGFQTGDPKANFHVKAGATGSLLLSASAQVSSGDVSASEMNPYITTTSLIFAGKYSGGGTFSYDLNALSGYVLTTTDQTIAGNKTFSARVTAGVLKSGYNSLFFTSVASYNTTSGSTISGVDFTTGVISVNPSAPQTITSPSASDIETVLSSLLGTVAVGTSFNLKYINLSAFTSTITWGSGISSIRGGASAIVLALADVNFIVQKTAATPTYLVIGN